MGRVGDLADKQIELRSLYNDGLAAYRRQDWDAAQTHFESCLQVFAGDGPLRLFLERITRLRNKQPSSDWDGIWHLPKTAFKGPFGACV
jgi:adenylate cyclase